MDQPMGIMAMPETGFFGMLLIGFLAGYLASRAMNSHHSLLTNMLVGIAGSFVGGALASLAGFHYNGFLGNLIVSTIGAVGILWFFGRRESGPRV